MPSTLIVVEPRTSPLTGSRDSDKVDRLKEHSADVLPGTVAAVRDTRCDRKPPRPDFKDDAVSDDQRVASHPVPPTDTAPEIDSRPMFAPDTVTLIEPVDGAFDSRAILIIARAAETAVVVVPACEDTVIDACRVVRSI